MTKPLDDFVRDVSDSGLLPDFDVRAWLDLLPADSRPRDGEQLARELVKQKKLTKFQAEQIYLGKGASLILGNYVILDKLGQGGMGMVLKAEHRRMKRLVAIKVMSPQAVKTPDSLKRFHREVEAAAKLRHPNIVAADDADEAKGTHFLVMEYVEGSDLSVLVKKNGPFPVDQAVRCMIQAAKGLEYAHKRGVVHRDIKPANLLLDREGTVKILDMGLARIEDSVGGSSEGAGLTSTGTIMGTVDYMSPEQAMDTKHADARSDIYSLGCSLYYLLVGKCLYDGDTIMKKLMAHQNAPVPELRSPVAPRQDSRTSLDVGSSNDSRAGDARSAIVSRSDTATLTALNAVFRRMVAKKPQDRPQTMTQVIAELERCLAGGSPTVAFERSGSSATHVAASGSSGNGNELQDFLRQISEEENSTATSVAPAGSMRTVAAPSSGEAETMISSADGAGTDPRTEQTVTLEQVGQRSGEPMGVSPRTVRGQTPSGSPSHRMKLLFGSVAAVVVLVAILFAVSGNRGQKESPRSKAEVAKGVGDVPSRGDSSSTPSQPVKDPDRDVAKWVIETGGSVIVQVEGKPAIRVSTVPELPKERFVVGSVAIVRQPSLTAADVERLTALTKLWGIGMELTPPTADAVRAMKNLRQLRVFGLTDLGNNRTSDEALVAVTELRQLEVVQLTMVQIPDEFFARVGQLPRLRDLNLYGATPMSAAQFELLAANPPKRLGSMNLSATPMTKAGLAALARLPHLHLLYLGRSNLDDDMLSALHSSKSLSIVHVRETAVSREGTDRLVAANGVCVVADPASQPSHINAEYWQTAQTLLSRGFGFYAGEDKNYPPGSTLPSQAEPITNVSVPDSATLDDLKSLATLKGISFFYGPLSADALQLLEPLSNLTSLNPGALTSGDISRIKNFPKLQDLTAAFPNDAAVATIASLPHLMTLDLRPQSQITDACLTSLRDAPILTRLHCFPPITRAAIESFVTARPDVDVVWNGETFNASAPEPPRQPALTPYEILTSPDYEWTPPENLGASVNTGFPEKYPALSADGLRLIYLSFGRGGLCESTRSSIDEPFGIGEWLEKEFEGGSAGNGTALSGDGLTLVFGSGRPGGLGDSDLWQATRPTLASPFGKPVCLTALNSPESDSCPTLSSDGLTIWFESNRPGFDYRGRWTSRRSSLTAEFQRPVLFLLPIVPEENPFSRIEGISFSGDERGLIFSPVFWDKKLEKHAPVDHFMSVRSTSNAPFGPPVNLSLPIQSEIWDGGLSLSADGTTLVFCSSSPGGLGGIDLWMTRRVKKKAVGKVQPGEAPKPAVAPFDAKQARAHQEAWAKHLGTTVETTNSVGAKMILIPPGEFLMGSSDEEIKLASKIADETLEPSLKGRIAEERPQHSVRITKPFRLGTHEVTIGQFAKFAEHAKYKSQAEEFGGNSEAVKAQEVKPDNLKLTWRTPGYAVTDASPVTQVNWNDAVAFCNWLSLQEKLDPCYQREGDTWMLLANANGYRLPTEAEWEYCCRAGTTTQFSFGDDWKGMDQFGWSKNNASGGPQSVGLRSANPFGLYDMHGNVWEWCHDGYDAKWYEKSPQDDPVGPIGSLRRVDRGGSWSGVPAFGRSAFRISSNLIYRYDDRGFRILRVLDAPSPTAGLTPSLPKPISAPQIGKPNGPAPSPAKAPFDAQQARSHQEVWAKQLGVPVEYTNSLGMKFSLIPPGEFTIGSTPEEIEATLNQIRTEDTAWRDRAKSEGPQHLVRLTQPIYLGTTEVTQSQYERVIGKNPSHFSATGAGRKVMSGLDSRSHPVETVSWHEVLEFCSKLGQREKLTGSLPHRTDSSGQPSADPYGLPTEAEWEFACRAGTTTSHWTGNDETSLARGARFGDQVELRTYPVGTLEANPFGLFDMHGNVWEWVRDGWSQNYYEQLKDQPAIDPLGVQPPGGMRVQRGGAARLHAMHCRSSNRGSVPPDARLNGWGFRIALSVEAVQKKLSEPEETTALQFDGSGARVEIPSLVMEPTKPITIEVWARPSKPVNHGVVAGFAGQCVLRLRARQWWFGVRDKDSKIHEVVASADVDWNKPAHVAGVFDGTHVRLFVDGIRHGEPVPCSSVVAVNWMATLGSAFDGTDPFAGEISQARFSQVARYVDDFDPPARFTSDKDTLALYLFQEGSGTSLKDESGHMHSGKIVNAKWMSNGTQEKAKAEAEAASSGTSPDRTAAEWVIGLGGEVYAEGVSGAIKDVKGLPAQQSKLTQVRFALSRQLTGENANLVPLRGLEQVVFVGLDGTHASVEGLEGLEQLPKLERLSMGGGAGFAITDGHIAAFARLKKLQKLYLAGSKVTPTHCAALSQALPNLETLNLQGNDALDDAGIMSLSKLSKLAKLQLQGTKVTAAGVASLKKSLPNCTIEWDDPDRSK